LSPVITAAEAESGLPPGWANRMIDPQTFYASFYILTKSDSRDLDFMRKPFNKLLTTFIVSKQCLQ